MAGSKDAQMGWAPTKQTFV